LYTNADQFVNKRDDLLTLIANNEPDVILINETIPKAQTVPIGRAYLNLDNFNCYTNFDPDLCDLGSSGLRGITIYVSQDLNVSEATLTDDKLIEHLFLRLKLRGNDSLLIGCIYRSPSSNLTLSTDSVCHLLQTAVTIDSHILLCGDFNYCNINWADYPIVLNGCSRSQSFLDTVMDLYLFQHVTQHTRFREGFSPHTLDLIFTNEDNMIRDLQYLPSLGNSDHVCLQFTLSCYTERSDIPTYRYNLRLADYVTMNNLLNEIDWTNFLASLSVDESWEYFSSTFSETLNSCIPLYIPRIHKSIYTNREVIRLKNRKNKLWKRYTLTRLPSDHKAFCDARNVLRSYTRQLRHDFELGICNDMKSNPKRFWHYVKSRLNTKDTVNELVDDNNVCVSEDADKAQLLNNYFCSVFTNEDSHSLPSFEIPCTIFPIDTIEISWASVFHKLSNINTSKSPGPDGWPPIVLKETADSISLPLFLIFNKSLECGLVPSSWKRGCVTPIFKKGSHKSPKNYRPITLTSTVGKILESLVRDSLLDHLNQNSLLNNTQHGFVPKRSCISQLLSVMEDWTSAIQHGFHSDVIYLDFSKAFDTVPHKRLILKLQAYGVHGKLLSWLTSFLTDRCQRVCLNGSCSDWKPVTSGVPQGSVLGPLLFVIYINDICSSVSSCLFKFADDVKLYRLISNLTDIQLLQKDIDSLYEWSSNWLLSFSIPKCKAMQVGKCRFDEYSYLINNQPLPTVCSEKDLGVLIDDELKFHQQTAYIVAKANRLLAIINKTFINLDTAMLPLLYKSLVRPVLEYANAVWGPFFLQDQVKIEKVQKRATRMVPSLRHLPYEDRLRALNLPSLHYRRKRGDMILVYQIFHGLIDVNPLTFFPPASTDITRGHNFKIFKSHTSCCTRSRYFSNRVINDWNSLPLSIVNTSSLISFKSLLDEHWKHLLYNCN